MSKYFFINDSENNMMTLVRENERGNFDKHMIKHSSIFEMSDEGIKNEIMYLVKKGIKVNIMPV